MRGYVHLATGIGLALTIMVFAVWILFQWQPEDAWTRAKRQGVIRIGYAVEPPHAFPNAPGEVTGESIESARKVAESLGISRIDWVQTDFDSLIPDLEANRFDVIAAGMFITPKRKERISFSRATTRVRPALLVPRGNPKAISTCANVVAQPELRIAVLSGAIEGDLLASWGVPRSQLVEVPDAATGQAAVSSGTVDGLALSGITLKWLCRGDNDDRCDVIVPFNEGPKADPKFFDIGFGFRKADRTLREQWDKALSSFIGSPEHVAIGERFGFGDVNYPKLMCQVESTNR